MSIFGNLTNDGLEQSQDRLGGFQRLDSDIRLGTIKMAYAGQSDGGARNVTLVLDFDGTEYRETIYITNKKGENFFLNKNDQTKKVPLPGFTTIDDLCLVTTEQPLAAQTTEDKMVNIYDRETQADKPTSVPMIMALIGKQAYFAILKQLEDKTSLQGNEYVPTGETRETNTIDKVFHNPTKMTVVEARQGADAPVFFDAWLTKNKGTVRDRSTANKQGGATAGNGAPGGAAAPTAGGGAPRQSLFGSK